jgi:tRNA(Arg) A34 adenosine deaminase TadA
MQSFNGIFMREAIRIAAESMRSGRGGPFGALVVKDQQIVGRGSNQVTSTNDPTAHAETVAIREACQRLGDFRLEGCQLYATCEPCPMCLGAIYWARLGKLFYAATRKEAAEAGFSDDFIYREIGLPPGGRELPSEQWLQPEALALFAEWKLQPNKILY